MDQNELEGKPFAWTKKSTEAAVLLAEDDLNDGRIAETVGTSLSTLKRWKQHPEFLTRVADNVKELEAEALRAVVNSRRKRQKRYADMDRRLQLIIEEREADYADAPGGKSGYIVQQKKSVGYGKNTQIVDEFAFDSALFREQRALMEQAAKDGGQWTEKAEVTGANGGPVRIREVVIDRTALPESSSDLDDEPDMGEEE